MFDSFEGIQCGFVIIDRECGLSLGEFLQLDKKSLETAKLVEVYILSGLICSFLETGVEAMHKRLGYFALYEHLV